MRALVADDEATNRILLKRLLGKWGYDVEVADNGTRAWEVLSGDDGPRLAVLDWQMPGLDGVDICRRLKGQRGDGYVYTVLVTHKAGKNDLSTGLDAGADDFIRKPVDPAELRSRLGVAKRVLAYDAKLADTNRLLHQYAAEMEALAEERAKQLVHADRMATLGVLSAGVAHEVNNPATFISGNAQTLERFCKDLIPLLDGQVEKLPAEDARKVRFILEEAPATIAGIQNGVARIAKIVSGLKAYARQERGERSLCALAECVQRATELCAFQLGKKSVLIESKVDETLPQVRVDAQQIEQVLVNLIVNAADAMDGRDDATIRISSVVEGDMVVLIVQDNGPGIPETVMSKVFDPFFTTKAPGKGTGLGLSICRRIVDDHAGRLSAHNLAEGGARFRVALPWGAEGKVA
ncbi:MAG: response regulator [Myxococcales bacterium]|nr:response regulator [Myxococcales bacterium]